VTSSMTRKRRPAPEKGENTRGKREIIKGKREIIKGEREILRGKGDDLGEKEMI